MTTDPIPSFPPIVISTDPSEGASIAVNSSISISFSKTVDTTSVENSVSFTPSINISSFSWSEGNRTLLIKTTGYFAYATDYTLTINSSATDINEKPIDGNVMDSDISFNFFTANLYYIDEIMIDNFYNSTYWQQPDYSGSTRGIFLPATSFEYTRNVYLPGSEICPLLKRSAFLKYQWEETVPAGGYLLREYLSTGSPRNVTFDTTYTLQCYVYGDGSKNKFRFCIDETHGVSWPDHEVSKWLTIDWNGWKLIEWVLSDPTSVGEWISNNNVLDGTAYRIDSFQLTHDNTGAISDPSLPLFGQGGVRGRLLPCVSLDWEVINPLLRTDSG